MNLVAVWQKHGDSPAYQDAPFFHSSALNRAIIMKHRLRRNEHEWFDDARTNATKVILPLDITNLRAGARSFFVGQRGFKDVLWDITDLASSKGQRDLEILTVLDELPSLDPFLMRERLKRVGIVPSRQYFEITGADSSRMYQFVRKEVAPLIGMSYTQVDAHLSQKAAKLATIILANSIDAELEPLRRSLGMDKSSFEEGMFCWKGFIYYKWTLGDLAPKAQAIMAEIAKVRPGGTVTADEAAYILAARERLAKAISEACISVGATLAIYDDAYRALTEKGQPHAFRDFMLRAPDLFQALGERLGGLQHITSFWRYRYTAGVEAELPCEELVELLADFEDSLGCAAGSRPGVAG
jgi:hypothetical protein